MQESFLSDTKRPSLFDILELRGPTGRQPNILGHMDDAERKRVLAKSRSLTLQPKTMLFRQGEWHEGIYIIESGLFRTFYTSAAGREITLAYWLPGNFVGGPDVFGDNIHMWSGMAVRETKLMAIKGTDLRALMAEIPALGIGMAEALVFKGRCFSSVIQMLGTRSVSERLSQLLLMLIDVHGHPDGAGGIAIMRQFTHEDLANMVGASRQWVTTTLDRLQRDGIVRIRKRQVVVLRPDLLAGLPTFASRAADPA
ncbi:MAG: Crp/Fnr family transcriptional regulator [Methyloligellaceae bacterium]